VKDAFVAIGGEIDLWRVDLRPGKPFAFGRLGEKTLFALPGNPVSALVTSMLFVRPAVAQWQGSPTPMGTPEIRELAEPLSNTGARTHFVRVRLTESGQIASAGVQGSHLLKSLSESDGLLEIPPRTIYQPGTMAAFWPWP
jgi:molybdopterin molybdotransferase